MAILEEQFTETLDAGAPDITYEGSEGREQQIAQALWDKLPPQVRMQFGSFQQFFSSGAWKQVLEMLQQQMQGREGQQEVQDPRLQQEGQAVQDQGMMDQGIGGLMPQAQPMGMAYGGTPGADGRRQYGIGSWFQEKIMDPIKKNIVPLGLGAASLYGLHKYGGPGEGGGIMGGLGKIFKGGKKILDTDIGTGKDAKSLGSYLMNPNFLIPAAGLLAGTFAKPDEPGYTGQGTGLNIADIGKLANISDPQVGQAAGLRFLPDVETRKFTPEQMLETYAQPPAASVDVAQGGRIGYDNGGDIEDVIDMPQDVQMASAYDDDFDKWGYQDFQTYKQGGGQLPWKNWFNEIYIPGLDKKFGVAEGGRIGFTAGGGSHEEWIQRKRLREIEKKLPLSRRAPPTKSPHTSREGIEAVHARFRQAAKKFKDRYGSDWRAKRDEFLDEGISSADFLYGNYAQGGRIGAQEGGLMDLGGMEKDYRNDGGFVPLGGEEKADDVPARLSRNEFVFTADAVRNAGGGDMDRGAEVMENVMKNLEGGGRISAESQGKGAGEMFEVSERLSEVV